MDDQSEKKAGVGKDASERTARGLLGVGALTQRVARPLLGKRGFTEGQVIGRWSEIVGQDLAAATAPEKIRFDRGKRTDGTLYLRVASGAAAALIQPQTPLIVGRINTFLGANVIGHIRVSQGPLPRRHVQNTPPPPLPLQESDLSAASQDVGSFGSESLTAALVRLGARLRARSS